MVTQEHRSKSGEFSRYDLKSLANQFLTIGVVFFLTYESQIQQYISQTIGEQESILLIGFIALTMRKYFKDYTSE